MQLLYLAFITSFLGSIPLGMINLTVVNLSIRKGFWESFKFSVGAAGLEFFQAFVSLFLLTYLNRIPDLTFWFKVVTIPIFLFLAWQNFTHNPAVEKPKERGKLDNPFIYGALISSINILAYPYWIVWGNFFISQGLPLNDTPHILLFSAGTTTGCLTALVLFGLLSTLISKKAKKFNEISHKIIGGVFLLLAIYLIITFFLPHAKAN